ncbi:MAG: hypothetical protein D3915_03515 [Candidatus Electrothrix sp. AU1_5]|nr:hypothetical protein [Candidatus Electrothrix gigas]MCI5192183.1 hypothetical protein [Candidatus Electrothrix gigas]
MFKPKKKEGEGADMALYGFMRVCDDYSRQQCYNYTACLCNQRCESTLFLVISPQKGARVGWEV